jgi:hypothetical protein
MKQLCLSEILEQQFQHKHCPKHVLNDGQIVSADKFSSEDTL